MELKEFQDFFAKSVLDIKDLFKDELTFTPDHISLLTVSNEDYQKAKQEFNDLFLKSKEIPHSGRCITIGELKNPLVESGYKLGKVELSEPKPGKVVSKRKIDHIAYIPSDYALLIKLCKENNIDIYDEMNFGDVRLCKWKAKNAEIEFRSSGEFCNPKDKEINSEKDTKNIDNSKPDNLQKLDLLMKEVEKYKNIAEEEKQKALRALADYQNLKKRIEIDREAFQFIANTALISKLLDINDDFFRANDFVLKEEDHNKVKSAFKSVHDKLNGVITEFGLEEIPVNIGDKFNMHQMEALGTIVTKDEKENDTVKHIASKGFKYKDNDQIVRPVRVIVAKYNPEVEIDKKQ